MNKLIKSIWFPIALFALLELIFFAIGFFFMRWVDPCLCGPPICPPCPTGNKGLKMLEIGIAPSIIISLAAYLIIQKKARK